MALLTFDHLYTYGELTSALHALADAHPTLMTVESVGTSHEGRDIWLATITNHATGPHYEKPAVWVDANIHSVEHTGCVAALYLVHKLVTTYGDDAQVTRAVDTRTFYVMPRVNPDGAELALATPPTYLRSSVRKWPRVDDAPGLVGGDVDGDGRVLTMRVPDPNGAWKVSLEDPRLMVARAPDEHGPGPYFRLLFEGTIRDYDGATIPIAPERRSLDLNRQFPAGWRVHGEQHGAGAFPLSEPETRALADALAARPNVCCYFAHH
ncbi:MAG TPA: M14 family metallopeptidase, partial [Acidimicrobiia bacterium]